METGLIVAAYGRRFEVKVDARGTIGCVPRGKRGEFACGDRVEVGWAGEGQGVIQRALPRRSLLYRSDAYREKLIAANATQILVIVATEPSFSDELVTRCLVAAEHQDLHALIVLNKVDLLARLEESRARLEPFRRAGYRVFELCAKRGAEPLRAELAGRTSVLVGPSGMGKSTLVNALVPGAAAATAEISRVLDAGKHTTTAARLYALDHSGALIDSPGMQVFGLAHVPRAELDHCFPEFRPYLGACRFRDCRHTAEPDCALAAAVQAGEVSATRLAHFRVLDAALAAIAKH